MTALKLAHISGHTFIINNLSDLSTVLDLGANAGVFSQAINESWRCKVHAVEPTPRLAEWLRANTTFQVYQVAVSGSGIDTFFRIDRQNSESSCLATQRDEHTIEIIGTTLTRLLEEIGHVDLLKIDVEGAEIGILEKTPDDVLQRIPQLTVEFHDFKKDSGISSKMVLDVCRRMRELGFEVYVNSFWTNGDVLFVNSRNFPTSLLDRIELSINGRWLPGIKRILTRRGVLS